MLIKVYHGSTQKIEHPLVNLGRSNLDFGRGFYVTDIKSQAERWAERVALLRRQEPVLNVYDMDIDKAKMQFAYLRFDAYDEQWLDFIIANRMGSEQYKKYDVIEGGVANDRVIDSIEAYMANLMTREYCLKELSKHQPNNQL